MGLGEEAVFYTTDPPTVAPWGGLEDVYHAVDFGPKQWVALNFLIQYMLNWGSGRTAPFNSEFYTGWYTHWGSPVVNTCVSAHSQCCRLSSSQNRCLLSASLFLRSGVRLVVLAMARTVRELDSGLWRRLHRLCAAYLPTGTTLEV